ncbi:hypothetical protein [Dictyobacter formicarum]|uniref:hypothetical protein n=1 Tax=Dictyobacter formicarum TaxID=2778368 RepID=UPI0019162902|nr:hypothetical protein [Dictyobacter formicarum]
MRCFFAAASSSVRRCTGCIYAGLRAEAQRFDTTIVGGNIAALVLPNNWSLILRCWYRCAWTCYFA